MLKLNLDIQRTTVELGSGQNTAQYTIEEMTQAGKDIYLSKQEPRLLRDSNNRAIGIKDQIGFRADLLAQCLRDANGNLVPEGTIQSWPAATVDALHTEAQKLNGLLPKPAEDAAKKESPVQS